MDRIDGISESVYNAQKNCGGDMKQWLTPDDIAQELGVPVETVRSWIRRKNRPLPAYRPGRHYLVKREDLDATIGLKRTARASEPASSWHATGNSSRSLL